MRCLISGAGGLVGSALSDFLTTRRIECVQLSRSPTPPPGAVSWQPQDGVLDVADLDGFDTVVHLAGENIASGRWSTARKQRIRDSRVLGTRLLAESLAGAQKPPQTLICASAVGYYGDRGDEVCDEETDRGQGFLADVVAEWEASAEPAVAAGIRVVHVRLGVILSPAGGALAAMLPPFRFGLGGPIGSGRQYLSWITLSDVVRGIDYVRTDETIHGVINVVSPDPVPQADFARALGRVLRRPAILPLPAPIVRLLMGEMGQELLLASTRVTPARLLAHGFSFENSDLSSALADLLGSNTD